MLRGPWAHFQYLIARERIAFTATFFGALLGTIYFAIKVCTRAVGPRSLSGISNALRSI
jgi:hypothetical protein